MRDFWQKLTIDWPCALQAWLWQAWVVMPAAALDRLTRRQLLHVLGFLLLLMFFQYVVALDLTFLFGIDLGLLIEVSAAVFVLGAASGLRLAARIVQLRLSWGVVHAVRHWRQAARNRRSRTPRALKPPKSNDEDGAVWAAFA